MCPIHIVIVILSYVSTMIHTFCFIGTTFKRLINLRLILLKTIQVYCLEHQGEITIISGLDKIVLKHFGCVLFWTLSASYLGITTEEVIIAFCWNLYTLLTTKFEAHRKYVRAFFLVRIVLIRISGWNLHDTKNILRGLNGKKKDVFYVE